MKRFPLKKALVGIFIWISAYMPVSAQEFYLNWAGDSAEVHYSPSNTYDSSLLWGGNIYWNSDGDLLTSLYIATPLERSGFTEWLFSVRLSLFYLSLDNLNASTAGVSVGFNAGYKFLTSIPISLVFSAALSPDIFNTGQDIDRMNQFGAHLQAELSPYLRGYLGYRVYTANLNQTNFPDKNKATLDDSLFLGFSLLF